MNKTLFEVISFVKWIVGEYRNSKRYAHKKSDFKFFGENVTIGRNVLINRPDRVILSHGVNIHSGTRINSVGGLYVGRYSGIGYNCVIFTADHRFHGAKAIPFDNSILLKPVIIRDFVAIGTNAKIMPGVEIGEGSIIGMGAVVTKDVKPCSIVVGNPASTIGFRNKQQFEALKSKRKFSFIKINKHGDYQETIFPLSLRKFRDEIEKLALTPQPNQDLKTK